MKRSSLSGKRVGAIIVSLLLTPPLVAAAQTPQPANRSDRSSFFIEWAGGAVGSMAGAGLTYLSLDRDRCGSEDLECVLERVAITGVGSVIGSGAGSWGLGRLAETDPSGFGAFLGALGGAVAGAGVVHLLTEETDAIGGDVAVLVTYGITQGLVSALGSAIGAAIRD